MPGTWDDYTKPSGLKPMMMRLPTLVLQRICAKSRQNSHGRKYLAVYRSPLAAGGCGIVDESCGHSLEAIAIAHKSSAFVDKIGEKVASDKVTLVDDGTIPGQYGSAAIDDEGHPMQRNVLIENGVLKSYMCDRYYGKLLGMESTGSGRRQNYTYAPVSRMTNTRLGRIG
ncbi:MAG: TldD/PmbA family protein [Lachnospiraceae bacterium]